MKNNKIKQKVRHQNRIKQIKGKEPRRRHKKQRPTHSHIQESSKNTKLEEIYPNTYIYICNYVCIDTYI